MATAALIPDAATYGTQQAYAQQAYDKAKSNLQNQQLGWLNQYGMTANYNPTSGSYENYHIDPYNQSGLIQQNRYTETQGLNAAHDNSVARGISGAGLGNQAGSDLRFQYGIQDKNLGNQFMQGMGQFGQQLSDASNSYQQSLYQAQMNAIQTALANQQFEQYNPMAPNDVGQNNIKPDDTTPNNNNQINDRITGVQPYKLPNNNDTYNPVDDAVKIGIPAVGKTTEAPKSVYNPIDDAVKLAPSNLATTRKTVAKAMTKTTTSKRKARAD